MFKVFCLPFAGGNKYSYNRLMLDKDPNFKFVPIELPGRGGRLDESLKVRIEDLADDVFETIYEQLDVPYAIFGHSMGSLIGYLVTQKIIFHGIKPPVHLIFTGAVAPSARNNREEKLYLLPKEKFRVKLRELGGCPDELLQNSELMNFFEPVLRADFQAVEEYGYKPSLPFEIPITVINGDEEDISIDEAMAWQRESSLNIEFFQLSGDHFFIFQHMNEIIKIIKDRVCINTGNSHVSNCRDTDYKS